MCKSIEDGGHRCSACHRTAAEAKLTSAEACASRAIANAQSLNGGSGLFLTPREGDVTADGSSLHLVAPAPTAPALTPGRRRKRLREIIDMLRGAAARRSAARRILAAGRLEEARLREVDAQCLRLDAAEAEHELALIAQAQGDDHDEAKALLTFEADACEAERADAEHELTLLRASWTARDDKAPFTKRRLRRVYLEGQPGVTYAWPAPVPFTKHDEQRVKDELAQIKREWSPRDDRLSKSGGHTARWERRQWLQNLPRHEAALAKVRSQWTAEDDLVVNGANTARWQQRVALEAAVRWGASTISPPPVAPKWTAPGDFAVTSTDDNCSRGHLGMLTNRAATARRLADARPSAADRASRLSEAAFEVTLAKHELARLRGEAHAA